MDYNYQDEKIGGGIITICVLHFIGLGLNSLSLLGSFFMKDLLAQYGVNQSTYILIAITSVIISIGAIFILRKSKIGIAIYYVGIIISFSHGIFLSGFQISSLIGLVLPILMGIFLNSKKELFGFGTK